MQVVRHAGFATEPFQPARVIGLGEQLRQGRFASQSLDVVGIADLNPDGEAEAPTHQLPKDIQRPGIPVYDSPPDVVAIQPFENLFLRPLGVQVDNLALPLGGLQEELKHFSLSGITGGVLDPVEVQADFAQHRAAFDPGPEFLQAVGVLRRVPGVDPKRRQNPLASFGDLQVALVGGEVHRVADGEDGVSSYLFQGRFQRLVLVVVQVGVRVDEHSCS